MKYLLTFACLGLLATPAFAGVYNDAVLADSPVAYWSFNGSSTANFGTAGSALNATVYDPYTGLGYPDMLSGTGVGGTGFDVSDGSAVFSHGYTEPCQYIEVTDPGTNSALDFSFGAEMSLELWFNPEASTLDTTKYLLGKGRVSASDATDQNYSLRTNSVTGEISFLSRSYDDTGWLKWTGYLPETMLETIYGNWHHLAFTHTWGNGSSTAVYFDGTDISSYGSWNELAPGISAGDMPGMETDEPLWLGATLAGDTNTAFIGQIDEVAIYNTALTATQVLNHYNTAGAPAFTEYEYPGFTNGDFEATPVRTGWNVTSGALPMRAHTGLSATGLVAGTQAAYISEDIKGTIQQSLVPVGLTSQWQMDMLFATEQPTTRSLHMALTNGTSPTSDLGIMMIINGDGQLAAYDSGWHVISDEVIDFSIDGDGDGSLDDPADTLNIYTLTIVGDYTTTPSYDVYLSEANSEKMRLLAEDLTWFMTDPDVGSSPLSMVIVQAQTDGKGGNLLLDQIVFGEHNIPVISEDIPGDANGDGKVDGSDVTILAGNWQYGVTAATASVPEPSVLIMFFGFVVMLLINRRRH